MSRGRWSSIELISNINNLTIIRVPFTTPDTSNSRHIKPQTHQTSDISKNIGLPTTQQIKIPFYISNENPIGFQVFR